MKITKEYSNSKLNIKNRLLGNCYKLTIDNNIYYYEFTKENNTAYIKYDNLEYIEYIVDEYLKSNEYVNIIKDENNNFYLEYDPVFTFKLPIECIQPSQLVVDENRIDRLESIIEPNNIHLSVKIIDNKYVLLDDHHILYALKNIGEQMVNVFINTKLDNHLIECISNIIYILKEQNITSIDKCNLVDTKTYEQMSEQYIELLNMINI